MDSAIRFRFKFEVSEYFAIDDASDERHEYVDGVIHPMSDEAYDALPIVRSVDAVLNTSRKIRARLGNPDADRLMVDIRVRNGHLGQPLLYGPPLDPAATHGFREVPNRSFIVELPPDDALTGFAGLALYREAPGLRDYILISQRKPCIVTWTDRGGGSFERRAFDHLDAMVPIESLAICLSVREIYASDPCFA